MMRLERNRWSAVLSANDKILLVGFGNMGQALVRGWLAKGHAASAIRVVDPVPAARAVAAALGVEAHDAVAVEFVDAGSDLGILTLEEAVAI